MNDGAMMTAILGIGAFIILILANVLASVFRKEKGHEKKERPKDLPPE